MIDRKESTNRDLISATEIATFAYCPEQWRLRHGLGLRPGNRISIDAGTHHHAGKAMAERVAGVSHTAGRALLALAFVLLFFWLASRR